MGKSHYNAGNTLSFPAGADLSTSQYLAVKNDGSGGLVLATAGTDVILGTIKVPSTSGYVSGSNFDVVEVFARSSSGTILAVASTTIAPSAAVTATTGGQVVTTTTPGDQIIGYYVGNHSAVANEIIEIMPSTGKY